MGQRAFLMASMLRNFSYTMTVRNDAQPSSDLAASLIEVYGDISREQHGYLTEERNDVGPLPIDRPNKMMSCSGIPMHYVRYS